MFEASNFDMLLLVLIGIATLSMNYYINHQFDTYAREVARLQRAVDGHYKEIQKIKKDLEVIRRRDTYINYGGTADVLIGVDHDFIEGEKVTYKVNERKEK